MYMAIPWYCASRSNVLLQVSMTLIALVSSGTGASGPSHWRSVDGAASGALSIPRNVIPATRLGDPDATSRNPSLGGGAGAGAAAVAATDEFLTFCVDFGELPEHLAVSRDYKVVAVTGCQSSGKSTLLNALFGTG